MPLVTRSLQNAWSARGLLLSANVRSCSRPCAVSPTLTRSVRCLASSDRSPQPGSGNTSSRGQGFGKSSRPANSKKQKAEVSNTAEALIQSLGGRKCSYTSLTSALRRLVKCGTRWHIACSFAVQLVRSYQISEKYVSHRGFQHNRQGCWLHKHRIGHS